MITSRKVDNKGFTLVEIMIAMFILTVGIMGVTGMFITTIKANKFARNTTVANRLAQNLMEQIKTQVVSSAINTMCSTPGWVSCSTNPGPPPTVTGTFRQTTPTVGTTALNTIIYNVTLVHTVNSPIAGLDTISIRIGWNDSYGSHTTKVVTYIGQ